MRRSSLLALLLGGLLLPATATAAGSSVRVIGGTDATATDAPWTVALIGGSPQSTPSASQFCGGTLVDATHVVTAAHCVAGRTAGAIDVFAGETDLGRPASGQRVDVQTIAVHPDYDPSTMRNDATVLTLAAPVTDPHAQPIGLAAASPASGTVVRISGWGDTLQDEPTSADDAAVAYPDQLQVNDVDVRSDLFCATRYPDLDADRMLCAGGPGQDTCQGDSGGPLVVPGATPVLAGITSFGTGCGATLDYPGVYAEVAEPGIRAFLLGEIDPAATPDPDPEPEPEPEPEPAPDPTPPPTTTTTTDPPPPASDPPPAPPADPVVAAPLVPAPATPVVERDTFAPVVRLGGVTALRLSRSGTLSVPLAAAGEALSGSVELRTVRRFGGRTLRLGKVRVVQGAGRTAVLKVKVPAAVVRELRRRGRLSVRLAARVTDASGNVATPSFTVTVRPARSQSR